VKTFPNYTLILMEGAEGQGWGAISAAAVASLEESLTHLNLSGKSRELFV